MRPRRPLTIGMPTTSFPTHPRDPAGTFVLGMARALARRGHRVEVLAPEPASGAESGAGPRTIHSFGVWDRPSNSKGLGPRSEGRNGPLICGTSSEVSVHWIPYLRPRAFQRTFHRAGAPENLARDPLAWLGAPLVLGALAQALRSQSAGWDAVVSHWGFPCGWLAALLAPRLPHVAFFHSGDVHVLARVPAIGAPIAQTIAGRARVLAFSSAELRERFAVLTARARSTARVEIAPMGIDPIEPAEREAARAALGIEPARFVVLAMSRLVPIKGLDVAVEAIARVPGASLVIAGDGPERSSLSQRARTLDVRFVGVIAGEDKRLWLHAADAFTAPSRSLPGGRTEGAPTAVLEAMHAGLPVIATRTGGLPELVCDGVSGLLIPPDEAGALAAAIETLMHQPGLRARLAEGARLRGAQAAWPALIDRIEAWIEPSPPPAFMASPGAPRAED